MYQQFRLLGWRTDPLPAHQAEPSHKPSGPVRAIVEKFQRLQDARIDVVHQCSIEIEQHDGRSRRICVQRYVPQLPEICRILTMRTTPLRTSCPDATA